MKTLRTSYIRFGEIPENEQSTVYFHGEESKKENGVSVYDYTIIDQKYHIVVPNPVKENTLDTIKNLLIYDKRKVYLVYGYCIGIGNDGEPLLKNIEIVRDITSDFYVK